MENVLWKVNRKLGAFTPRIERFVFLIGAMKSGTTTLAAYLAQHPQISENQYMKEPEFFSRATPPEDLDRYFRQWSPLHPRCNFALEGSTGYTKRPAFPNVAARLAEIPQEKRFLYIVRNPIDRIESHIAHNLAAGEVTADRLSVFKHPIAVSSYAYQLSAYRSAMPEAPIKVLDFDLLRDEPLRMLRDVCEFLSIDAGVEFGELEPQNTRRSEGGANRFKLDPETRAELQTRLADDMKTFRDDWSFDVGKWGF